MKIELFGPLVILAASACCFAQDGTLRIIAFGAHPDDAEIRASGTAALFARMGHKVKFVAVTNGDAGHPDMGGAPLAKRRFLESQEVARRLGITYDVLDNHDGELEPSLKVRHQIIRKIREWNADVVMAPRPNDYHPDHRYTGVNVQDAAYMVQVDNVVADTPPLRKNPLFLYFEDNFRKPTPFTPDIVIDISEVWEKKLDAMDANVSQFYEYQPAIAGIRDQVPKDPAARREWLSKRRRAEIRENVRASLAKWYGPERANKVQYYEAFEVCEYGARPDEQRIRQLFPMLK
jgi:LmbE family N-acetylglucosaminyl deacetylase